MNEYKNYQITNNNKITYLQILKNQSINKYLPVISKVIDFLKFKGSTNIIVNVEIPQENNNTYTIEIIEKGIKITNKNKSKII